MKYQGYEAAVEYDEEDRIFVGRVINIQDIIAFDGESVVELELSFHAAVNDYLADCARQGKEPDKPFSGRFNLRLPPQLHRDLVTKARVAGISLNDMVTQALEEYLKGQRTA